MKTRIAGALESPEYVRVSSAAAMTLGLMSGRFLRGAKLYCINLLLTYENGCVGKCAYCAIRSVLARPQLYSCGP